MTTQNTYWLRYLLLCMGLALGCSTQTACYLDPELKRVNPYDKAFNKQTECRDNDDCSKVGYCLQGKCVQCRTSTDCEKGQACIDNTCSACKTTKDCSNGQACISGTCSECTNSLQCGSAQFCRDKKCVSCDSEKAGTCILSGTITENLKLSADTTWILRGTVFIGDDVKAVRLEIEPGTTIAGESSTNGVLVIRRNAKIIAEGTKEKPIVFTSDQPKGSRGRGDWGGIVINGRARTNRCVQDSKKDCESFGEGGTGWYGGDDDNDSSGILKYVRVEFSGRLFSPDNELNGIAFQGVGAGTTIDYIQVHMSKDDGVEFFGGTAQAKHILVTGAADDSIDWTDGWRGKIQFAIIQQYADASDNGIEADNHDEDNTLKPRSNPTLSHLTIIGSPQSSKSDIGVLLREGTAGKIYNSLVLGFEQGCFGIDKAETFKGVLDAQKKLTGQLVFAHSRLHCTKAFIEPKETQSFTVADFFNVFNTGNKLSDPLIAAPFNTTAPNFAPKSGAPVLSGALQIKDSFFSKVKYLGSIEPGKDWTKGWTTTATK